MLHNIIIGVENDQFNIFLQPISCPQRAYSFSFRCNIKFLKILREYIGLTIKQRFHRVKGSTLLCAELSFVGSQLYD